MTQAAAKYEHYKRIKLLGEGSSYKTYLVECVSDSSLCVIKQINLNIMTEEEKKDTLTETKTLKALNHRNIIKFREVYKTKKGKLCLVMEYIDGGDLTARIRAQRNTYFTETQILEWFTQICLGLKHVHDRKILHRNLKCQNFFLTKTNIIKLGNFSIATDLSTRRHAYRMIGMPYYLSPEIINGKPYSFKSDIWSLGVTLYQLCALKPPFDAISLSYLALKIVRGQYSPLPSKFSNELKNLVATLLQVDPTKRPDINGILEIPIVKNNIKSRWMRVKGIKRFTPNILQYKQIINKDLNTGSKENVDPEMPVKKEQQLESISKDCRGSEQDDQGTGGKKTDFGLNEMIPEFNKLDILKDLLKEGLGSDIFDKAYKVMKELLEKHEDLTVLVEIYGKDDKYQAVFPFMTKEAVDKYLPLMFTYFIMEVHKVDDNNIIGSLK